MSEAEISLLLLEPLADVPVGEVTTITAEGVRPGMAAWEMKRSSLLLGCAALTPGPLDDTAAPPDDAGWLPEGAGGPCCWPRAARTLGGSPKETPPLPTSPPVADSPGGILFPADGEGRLW